MIWFLLALILLGCGCLEARQPYRDPAGVEPAPALRTDPGFRVVQRLDVGGSARVVVADADGVFVATPGGIDRHVTVGGPPVERILLPGYPARMELTEEGLWVALNRGGAARIRNPHDPATREVQVWPVGGLIHGVSPDGDRLWMADEIGRVLSLDFADAADAPPAEQIVEGWPQQVLIAADRVLVPVEYGGLEALAARADGTLERVPPPLDPLYVSTIARDDGGLWISTYFQVIRHTDQATRHIDHPHACWNAVPTDGGVLLSARGEGVLFWDGSSEELVQHQLELPGTGVTAEPRSLAHLGDDTIVLAAGKAGVVWADTATTPWSVSGWYGPGGLLRALEPHGEGAIAVVSDDQTASAVALLELGDDGTLTVADRIAAPPGINGAVVVDGQLLLGGDGLLAVDLDAPPGERRVTDLGITSDKIGALTPLPGGRVAALAGSADVLWLARDGTGQWTVEGASKADQEWMPIALGSHRGAPAVSYAGQGRLKVFPEPGAEPDRQHLLQGEVAFNEGAPLRPGGLASDGERIWVAIPHLGIESVDPATRKHTVLHLDPGGWDVHPWGDRLAVALGPDGVAIVDPTGEDPRELARCALPGDTWFVLPMGDRLLAGAGGTLYLLETPTDLP